MQKIEKYTLENFDEIEVITCAVNDNLDAVNFEIEIFEVNNISVDLETYMEGLLQTTGIEEYNKEEMTITSYCEFNADDVDFDAIDYINDHWDDAKGVLMWYLKRLFEESVCKPIILENIKKAA